jgi:hypothetical protein
MTDSKPVGWRVSGVPASDHAELIKQTPFEINCKTKEEAEHQKQMMKERGWVATVTPIFVTRATVARRNKKAQVNPFGDFRKDWKLF